MKQSVLDSPQGRILDHLGIEHVTEEEIDTALDEETRPPPPRSRRTNPVRPVDAA